MTADRIVGNMAVVTDMEERNDGYFIDGGNDTVMKWYIGGGVGERTPYINGQSGAVP